MRFEAKVETDATPALDEAVPGASGSVVDRSDNASLDSLLDVVRNHLQSARPGTTITITATAREECGAREPNQSVANAAVCDQPAGHPPPHQGPACGPAAAERPGRHAWQEVTL